MLLLSPIYSPVQVWVIPTNEELAIGRDVKLLLEKEEYYEDNSGTGCSGP